MCLVARVVRNVLFEMSDILFQAKHVLSLFHNRPRGLVV